MHTRAHPGALKEKTMENWKVGAITLLARGAGRPEQSATLPCAMVSLESAGDIAADRLGTSLQAYVLARGVPVERLAEVGWTPTHLRFTALGYQEPREFIVTGWDADPQAGTVKFALP
jgi:hypothetical protein